LEQKVENNLDILIFLSLVGGSVIYGGFVFEGILYIIFAVGCFILFPAFQYKRHVRYFSNYVEDKYSELFGEVLEISLDQEYLYIKVLSSESKIAFCDIKEILEIEEYFILRFKLGRTALMPKKQISNFEEIKTFFLLQTTKLGVPFKEDLG
jgi:hypothetical protein